MIELQPSYCESFTGRLVDVATGKPALLVIGRGKLPSGCKLLYRGNLSLRFAFPLLFTTDHMFPQLAIDDFRREYHGKAAIEFMLNKGNSYPRGDAIGLRMSDGRRGDFYMKEVDIAAGLHAFAYTAEQEDAPLVRVGYAVWLDMAAPLADGIIDYADADGSLLRHAAQCVRCNPAALPILLERVSQTGSP